MPKPHENFDNPELSSRVTATAGHGVSGASVESTASGSRRKFTVSEKQRIVKAAEHAVASGERGALAALLRREGVYSSQLAVWRGQFEAGGAEGLAVRKRGRKPKLDERDRALLALTKRNAALEKQLQIARALIDLQKKAHLILGIALPTLDEENL